MKKILLVVLLLVILIGSVSCSSAADTASYNTSKAADNFEIYRQIVFYNSITDKQMFVMEGYCSLGNNDPVGELSITCKVGPDSYEKHFLEKSDNVAVMVLQLKPATVDPFHYRFFVRPESIIPNVDIQTSGGQ